MKFALRNYAGQIKKFFIAEERTLPPVSLSAEVGHHILVVDRSGSMYYSMTELRSMVEKVLTIEEFANAGQLVSLLSYSSQGDLTVHFERTPVQDVLAPGSRHVESIRQLRATALTCVSQALEYASKLVRPTETTGVSVHTDGYFNDRSPTLEQRAIDRWIEQMRPAKNVFVNTIAYGGWCDYVLLDRMANALSGKMVRASTAKDVYQALHDTSKLLAGRTVPSVTLDSDGSWQVAYAPKARKVNGTAQDITLRGLGPDETPRVWRFRQVTEAAYSKSKEVENGDLTPIYAFARTSLAAGRLNDAKYAFVTTRDARLGQFAKAITPEQLADFAEALDGALYGRPGVYTAEGTGYGLSGGKCSIPQLCDILLHHRNSWSLDLPTFLAGYQKRGLKLLQGSWVTDPATNETTFVPASYKLVSTEDQTCLSVSAFEFNNSTATINMLVTQKANLADAKTGDPIAMVGGQKLDLRQHNNYTLVGDGVVNAKVLPIFVATQGLWRALVSLGVAEDNGFRPGQPHIIDLTELPVLDYASDLAPPKDVFSQLAGCKILLSLINAALPSGGEAALDLTDEQKAELSAHDLTAKLNFSPPTTTPYTDLTVAVATGLVDLRTSYKVEFLGTDIAGLGDLYSANAAVQRYLTVKKDDKELEKFTVSDALMDGVSVSLTPPKKINSVDAFTLPYICDFFRVGYNKEHFTTITALLKTTGYSGKWLADYMPEKLVEIKKYVEAYQEGLYSEQVRPAAFYIGSTGMLPDTWGEVPALDADSLKARIPTLGLSKKQKENGTFFVLDKIEGQPLMVLGVYAENVYFSTPAGVAAAKAISSAEAE